MKARGCQDTRNLTHIRPEEPAAGLEEQTCHSEKEGEK